MKVAVITGGTRGIGKSAVELFSQNDYQVIFFYKKNTDIANDINKSFGAKAKQVDISDYDKVEIAINSILKDYKKIDVLINNAGIAQTKLFTDISLIEWHNIINTNLNSMFYTCKAVLPNMISNKYGKIINVSSMWGIYGASMEVHYSTSKAGVIGLTKALAKELAPSNITVNCIAPGAIETEILSEYTESDLKEICNNTPLLRLGKPIEVAELMLFLASDKSNFITGQTISIDGGYGIN